MLDVTNPVGWQRTKLTASFSTLFEQTCSEAAAKISEKTKEECIPVLSFMTSCRRCHVKNTAHFNRSCRKIHRVLPNKTHGRREATSRKPQRCLSGETQKERKQIRSRSSPFTPSRPEPDTVHSKEPCRKIYTVFSCKHSSPRKHPPVQNHA